MTYNEYCKVEIGMLLDQLKEKVVSKLEIPSTETIFRMLETFSYDISALGKDVGNNQEVMTNFVIEHSTRPNVEIKKNAVRQGYTTVVSRHKDAKNIEYNDLIWLHFSLTESGTISVFNELMKVLIENNMSFVFKTPEKIGPDAIVLGMYTKEDAKIILDYCKDNKQIIDNLTINNPFMPHENGVGIVMEVKGRSYTHHLSYLLNKYAVNMRENTNLSPNSFTLENFCKYVNEEFNMSRTSKSIFDRYLNYQVLLGLNCIIHDKSYLDHLKQLEPIEYEKEFYARYRMHFENNKIIYLNSENNEITEESNYILWLKLQAHSCLQRMYFEKENEIPKESEPLSINICGYLSEIANRVLAEKYYFQTISFADDKIADYFPYLVAYYAYEKKMALPEEANFIVQEVKKRIVVKTKVVGQNHELYTVDKLVMPSTIPPIKMEDYIVGIEYIDYEQNFCDISIMRNNGVEKYLGVFLDADKEKLWGEKLPGASLYRATLARILIDKDNISTENITRGTRTGNLLNIDKALEHLSNLIEELYPKQQK